MEVTDFLVELEGNPDDAVMFDRAVEEALAEGGVEGLESFLAQVMEGDRPWPKPSSEGGCLFRRERTSDKVGSWHGLPPWWPGRS